MHYDIIGDIHGEADALERLLKKLGYQEGSGAYTHPTRTVIFLGDFVDRGLAQQKVISIVRAMSSAGSAQAVMGNHEFNAIAYATPDEDDYLRKHSEKNRKQHLAFLEAYQGDSALYAEVISWFKQLPLWLDLEGLRVVHACWDESHINRIVTEYGRPYLTNEMLRRASNPECWEYDGLETLLKGREITLPSDSFFHDKDGVRRDAIRVKWWESASTYRAAYIGPPEAETDIPDDPITGDHLIEYSETEKPVFIGHYWLTGSPVPLAPNIACVDYSVAKEGGQLVAYRFDGEATLSSSKFVAVER